MIGHCEAENSEQIDKWEQKMRKGASLRLLHSEGSEENEKSKKDEITPLTTAPSSPNMWKRRRLHYTHDKSHWSNGQIELKSMKEIILARIISEETNECLTVKSHNNATNKVDEESEQGKIIPDTSSIKIIKLSSSSFIGQENSFIITQQTTASDSNTIKEILKMLGGLDELGDATHRNKQEPKSMPNEYGVLGETSGERHGKRYSIVENVDIEFEFASIFPLRSANDLEALERMIADNKDDFKKKLVSRFSQLIGSTTGLETFVTDAWKLAVADSLGRDLNWEGRRDARVQSGQKISVKNSALVRMMKIALQSIPRFRDCLTLDVDFKKKTNTHFRNSWGRFARANPNHPDVEKWRRLRRTQQE